MQQTSSELRDGSRRVHHPLLRDRVRRTRRVRHAQLFGHARQETEAQRVEQVVFK